MYTAIEPTSKIGSLDRQPWLPVCYRVKDKVFENKNLATLLLAPVDPQHTLDIFPGQFNMLYVFGVGEIPVSISSLSVYTPRLIHTIQDVGAVSHALVKTRPGDCIGVRGPYGRGWPLIEALGRDVLIVAGGVGLAPLRPVIEHLLANRPDYRQINVLFGARSPENMLFYRDIISWQSNENINFHVTVDYSYNNWHGNVGVVTELIKKARFDPDHTVAMVCGPEIMMRYAISHFRQAGIHDSFIYLSMERNMKCALGACGHCQFGPYFVCREGPVFSYTEVSGYLNVKEL